MAWLVASLVALACLVAGRTAYRLGHRDGRAAGFDEGDDHARRIAAGRLRTYAAACDRSADRGHWTAAELADRQGMIAAAPRLRQVADELDPPAA